MVRALSGQSPLKTTPKSALAALLLLSGIPLATGRDLPRFDGPVEAGLLAEPANGEASGLAASRRTSHLLWTHNDSGGEPVLFAVGSDGALRGKLRLQGINNTDWEDLAAAVIDGQPTLLVADIGDNSALYPRRVIRVLAEPDPAQLAPDRELMVAPAYSINYVYEDGARDAEGLAVDAKERALYIISKRNTPARLYRLPLQKPKDGEVATARLVGTVPHLPQPGFLDKLIQTPLRAYRGWPTALDFSDDGRLALVLTYGRLLLFPREDGETWADALARAPVQLAPFDLPQAEGACFSADGSTIHVCSEQNRSLLRYTRH